jgi:hypothetical protein
MTAVDGNDLRPHASDDNDMKQHDASHTPGSGRPPEYVVVVAASDWVTEHFPAAGASLLNALKAGQGCHHDPEPDLEAEP